VPQEAITVIEIVAPCYKLGLKKNPFSFLQKAKISKKNFVFAKVFEQNFCFRESFHKKFLFLRWFSRKVSVFSKDFHQGFGSGYTLRWLLYPDLHSEWKIFAKTKIFISFFRAKRKKLLAKFSQKYENEHFHFNPTIYPAKPLAVLILMPQGKIKFVA
jgi:hypothetical protein